MVEKLSDDVLDWAADLATINRLLRTEPTSASHASDTPNSEVLSLQDYRSRMH